MKATDSAAYELLRLLARSVQDGMMDVREFPTFVKLYGPRGRDARKLRKEAEKKAGEVGPILKKARSVKLAGRLNRRVERRLRKSVDGLKRAKDLLRGLGGETVGGLRQMAPEWAVPLTELVRVQQ